MKIAVIGAKGLPPQQGGIEHYCAELYPRLVAQGHSVDFYARSNYTGHSWFHRYQFQGVNIITLPCLEQKGLAALMSSALAAMLASRYDIVHFHALGPALFCWIPRLFSSATVLVTCHGLDWRRDKWGWWSSQLIQLGEKMAVRFAHHLLVVSQDLATYFQNTYQRNTIYIPNAPPTYAQSNPAFEYGQCLGLTQNHYILFLGRLVPEKCPHILIQAFQRLKMTGWKLILLGSQSDTPSYADSLKSLANKHPNILFMGELREHRLAEIVRGAGLFVLPSRLEGLPLAMLEAMAEGIPCLASDIAPHRQLLEPDRGLLFKAENVEQCCDRIAWAIQHPAEMAAMASRAQKHVHQYYTWQHIIQEHLNLIESRPPSISGKTHPPPLDKTISVVSSVDQ